MSPVRVSPSEPFDLGQAEVGDPDVAGDVEQEVGRLDVAVQDPLLVGVGQGLGDLDADPGHRAVELRLGRQRQTPRCRSSRTRGRTCAAAALGAAT